jgi:hypothetical protein
MPGKAWLTLTGRDNGLTVIVPVSRVFFVSEQSGGGCEIGVDAHDPVTVRVTESGDEIASMLSDTTGGA